MRISDRPSVYDARSSSMASSAVTTLSGPSGVSLNIAMTRTESCQGADALLGLLSAQPDTKQKRPPPGENDSPASKRQSSFKPPDTDADGLPFSIDFGPNSSPLRAGTFSPEFFNASD